MCQRSMTILGKSFRQPFAPEVSIDGVQGGRGKHMARAPLQLYREVCKRRELIKPGVAYATLVTPMVYLVGGVVKRDELGEIVIVGVAT